MAALGFSVLMREWRRGMAFDPWHGSLYLSLSTVITLSLSPPFFLSLLWIEKQTCTTGFDQLSTAHLTLFRTTIQSPSSTFTITQRDCSAFPFLTTCKRRCWLITLAGKEKKRQKQICENIILFVELCNEKASQSSCSSFISYVCPNHTRALWFFKEVVL